jgi:cytochrome P450
VITLSGVIGKKLIIQTITYALYDLCLHPEYVEPLRKEVDPEGKAWIHFIDTVQGLPLLDSFMKESARLTPVEASECCTIGSNTSVSTDTSEVTTRRKALKPFSFTGGKTLNTGDWACIPVQAMLQDEQFYPNATTFQGFRFVNPASTDQKLSPSPQPEGPSQFTDVSNSWHVWGTGKMTW